MKFIGGHTPKIAGRPSSIIEELPLSEKLCISLHRGELDYVPVVQDDQKVEAGDSLAEACIDGGNIALPAPVAGTVSLKKEDKDTPSHIILENIEIATEGKEKLDLNNIDISVIRKKLAKSGVWPFLWSSKTGNIPTLLETEQPKSIIVNCVLSEPFRARGKVVIRSSWKNVFSGIKVLTRLLADSGKVEVVLADSMDPVSKMISEKIENDSLISISNVSVKYPVENARVLNNALRMDSSEISKDDIVWVIDVQGVEAIGACLVGGESLHRRIVALGGPGQTDPKHVSVTIGSRINQFICKGINADDVCVLSGGLFNGIPVDIESYCVQYDDDAFFFLPEEKNREFLSFVNPGLDRTSILPCFLSYLTKGKDRRISTRLRGERRPCIACGLCEEYCPAGIMPQIIHRYLYAGLIDEAEAVGLEKCVGCAICTYICPSKIELHSQFAGAKDQLREEKRIAEEAEAKNEEKQDKKS